MSARDYADFLFMRYIAKAEFDLSLGDGWVAEDEAMEVFSNAMERAFAEYGIEVGDSFDALAKENLGWLIENRGMLSEGDLYTGKYLKVSSAKKAQMIAMFLAGQEVAKRIETLGEPALRKALSRLAQEQGWPETSRVVTDSLMGDAVIDIAPASDRVVTFSDNQISILEQQTTDVIEAVFAQNQIDSPGFRELLLGQLRAGRELIRAGSVRLYLLELTLIESLRFLIKRYEGQVVGGLASALLTALVKAIGIDA